MHRKALYRWASPGDLNAFFGLSIDNLAVLVLTVSLLATVFGYPAQFALSHLQEDMLEEDVIELIETTWVVPEGTFLFGVDELDCQYSVHYKSNNSKK